MDNEINELLKSFEIIKAKEEEEFKEIKRFMDGKSDFKVIFEMNNE